MIVTDTAITYVREKLKAPFGFKGGLLTELWQVVCKIETQGAFATGVGVQSVLWSDKSLFEAFSELDANLKMVKVTEYVLRLIQGRPVECPVDTLDEIYSDVLRYAKETAGVPRLRETFVRNALVAVDNALWRLWGNENRTENFLELIPGRYKRALTHRHEKLCNIPLITYGTSEKAIRELLRGGAVVLKIKIGSDPERDGDLDKTLEWDKKRIERIHDIAAQYKTEHTKNGKILYYLDANGRYDTVERVENLLDFAKKAGALENIILFEEPFEEDNKLDVSRLPVRMAADESVHSACDVEERAKLGYRAVALKPIAKTLSETLKILDKAYECGLACFCADLTVNPFLTEFNKNIAARIATLPELDIGLMESNGEQNYVGWEDMYKLHPMKNARFARSVKGLYDLDDEFFETSGGIFRPSGYDDIINKKCKGGKTVWKIP